MERRVILCEGKGDKVFFERLIANRGLPQFTVIYPNDQRETAPGGRSGFPQRLKALQVESGFSNIMGILVTSDNDEDPNRSFGDIQAKLREAGGFGVPVQPSIAARSQDGFPTVVVLMLPRTGQQGNLETLCLPAIYDRWPNIKTCLDEFAMCAGVEAWPIGKASLMRLRSMIAAVCRSDPNTGLPYAWSRTEELIPLEHNCFDHIADLIRDFDDVL